MLLEGRLALSDPMSCLPSHLRSAASRQRASCWACSTYKELGFPRASAGRCSILPVLGTGLGLRGSDLVRVHLYGVDHILSRWRSVEAREFLLASVAYPNATPKLCSVPLSRSFDVVGEYDLRRAGAFPFQLTRIHDQKSGSGCACRAA
jgi:hypothetical protein